MLNLLVQSTLARRILTIASILIPSALAAQGLQNPLRDEVVRSGGRVIVTLRSSIPDAAMQVAGAPPVTATELVSISDRLEAQFQLRERSHAAAFGMIMGDVSPDQVNSLASDPNVASVEADRLWASADVGDGISFSDRWAAYRRVDDVPYGVTQVTAPTVWAGGNRGEGVKVAAMDSGGDVAHPDLAYAGGYNAMTMTTSGWADDIAPCNGHGTHVAGTIAARDNGSGVVGVAPRAQLYAIKVFENVSGSCLAYTSSQINGLNWAVSQGIRLVNVSIGGTFSPSYDAAINSAASNGTYLIAAAGNNGGAVLYPGSSQYSIAVAAVDGGNLRASWSDFGPEVDFSAPGVGINSTMPGGGYGSKSGTSMATPHVVGVSALILSAYPSLTFAQLYQKLRDGALDLESAGFDNNTGYGLVRAANSIGGGAPPPTPLVLAVSPAARNASVVQGASAPSDQAGVTLSGTNSTTTPWSATKQKSWTTLTTASGAGSGTLAWSRNATGLAVGTYVDTLTVTATGVATPSVVYDTLRITAAPVPVVLAVSPTARSLSVAQGTTAAGDQASVTLSGTNSTTTSWSATKRKSWTTLTTGSGIGSGTLAWSRNATGLAVGTYVDTLTVTATGVATPSVVYDTLRITVAPVPLALAVSSTNRNVSAVQGTAAPSDQVTVTQTGDGHGSSVWSATKRQAWTTLISATGSGGAATLAWSRNASGLAVGLYVDTIAVTAPGATGSPAFVYDTLRITAASVPIVLAVSPTTRTVSVAQGTTAPGDQASVTLSGTNSTTTPWSATKLKSWTTLNTASGAGSGTLAWSRNATGLAVGTYVDTLTVTATGVATPSVVYDTLRITAAPVPLVLTVSPTSRSVSVAQGTTAAGDQASVTMSGTNGTTTTWSATKRKSWTTLTTASGVGSGTLAWSRNATGLAVGTYVDTLTVTAAGVTTPSVVYDTLRVTAAPVPISVAVAPGGRRLEITQGSAASEDSASVILSGTGSVTTGWLATQSASWATLTIAGGTGGGTLRWSRSAGALAVGIYVDTIRVSAAGATAIFLDTLSIAPAPQTIAFKPKGKRSRLLTATGAATEVASTADSALVEGDVAQGESDLWLGNTIATRLRLVTESGQLNHFVVWQRLPVQYAPGIYIDSIVVRLQRDPSVKAVFTDTLEVVAVQLPEPIAAVDELFGAGRLSDDQRALFDREGNGNGRYDLGDFLAWADRAHLRLSPEAASRLQGLMLKESAPATTESRTVSKR